MDISKHIKMNKNVNTKYQNLCGIGKVLRKKCIILHAYTRKEEKFKIRYSELSREEIRKREPNKPKQVKRRK